MKTDAIAFPPLLSFPMSLLSGSSQLRVMEPLDTPISPLCERLLLGTYDKPFIIEDGQLRCLHLGIAYVQSAMRIDAPDALDLRYTQKMMGFLLFDSCPGRIVMLGLGGGSLAKFCYRLLPTVEIDVVEINPHVIALRRHFAIPEDDARFRVICEDAAEFVARTVGSIDVLLADAFDDHGLAGSLARDAFLSNVHASLAPAGMLVMNLAGDKARYVDLIEEANNIFDHRTVLVRVEDGHNHVLFAFKDRMFDPGWRQLRQRAAEIRAQCGLDLPTFVHKMEQAARNRSRTRSA